MASLADLTPPIALGSLDGRYRRTVAPLVDHLSEPALNRTRLHVEIEWLIHLTTHGVVPGAGTLTEAEAASLRGLIEEFDTAAIDELAAAVPNGALMAATDPAQLLTSTARRLAAMEAVVEAARKLSDASLSMAAATSGGAAKVNVQDVVEAATAMDGRWVALDTALAALEEVG